MHNRKIISVTSHALDPSPVTNCHTFSNPLPLERDVLYGRPLAINYIQMTRVNASLFLLMTFKLSHMKATFEMKVMRYKEQKVDHV